MEYMAPEVFKGEAKMKSVVWSLGVSLFELAECQNPFKGNGNPHVDDYCSWVICRRCILFVMKNPHPSPKANGLLNSLISFACV